MSSEVPSCDKCGQPYTVPVHYRENAGLCTECRPIKICEAFGGQGRVFITEKPGDHRSGFYEDCAVCHGTRHERRGKI